MPTNTFAIWLRWNVLPNPPPMPKASAKPLPAATPVQAAAATGEQVHAVVKRYPQFSRAECTELVRIVGELKPVGNEMWKEVEAAWTAVATSRAHEGFHLRPASALRGKFSRLVDVKKPTGEGNLPDSNQIPVGYVVSAAQRAHDNHCARCVQGHEQHLLVKSCKSALAGEAASNDCG